MKINCYFNGVNYKVSWTAIKFEWIHAICCGNNNIFIDRDKENNQDFHGHVCEAFL